MSNIWLRNKAVVWTLMFVFLFTSVFSTGTAFADTDQKSGDSAIIEDIYFTLDGDKCEGYGFNVAEGQELTLWVDVNDGYVSDDMTFNVQFGTVGEYGCSETGMSLYELIYDDESGLYYCDASPWINDEWFIHEILVSDGEGNEYSIKEWNDQPLNRIYFLNGADTTVPEFTYNVNFWTATQYLEYEVTTPRLATLDDMGIDLPQPPEVIGAEFIGWEKDYKSEGVITSGDQVFHVDGSGFDLKPVYSKYDARLYVNYCVGNDQWDEKLILIGIDEGTTYAQFRDLVFNNGYLDEFKHDPKQKFDCWEYTFYEGAETVMTEEWGSYLQVYAEYHDYSGHEVEPTCTERGYTIYTCECGDSYVKYVKALGHDLIKYDGEPAACTEEGWKAYKVCSRCDYTTYTAIPPKGHEWEDFYTVDKKATTKAAGSKSKHCADCNEIKSGSKVTIAKIKKTTASDLVYNGKQRTANVTVVNNSGKKLVKGTDFTVTYKNAKGTKAVTPKNVGTYKAVVKFKGQYSGTVTKTFKINPQATKITKLSKNGKKQFTVKWTKKTAQVTGYQIRYSTKKKMDKAYLVPVNRTGTTKATVKYLKANETYYVQVRTYKTVNGTKYYSAWSDKQSIKTK